MKPYTLIFAVCLLLGAGCTYGTVPERSLADLRLSEVYEAFRDFQRLAARGVEQVLLTDPPRARTVPLAHYLFGVAERFESLGRPREALKTYFHLAMRYALLDNRSTLGRRVDNRIRWHVGDKSWVRETPQELAGQLETALRARDFEKLERLISRDFAFGQNGTARLAVDYRQGLRVVSAALREAGGVEIDSLGYRNPETWVVRMQSESFGDKTWYFTLHEIEHPKGWEWDMAFWRRESSSAGEGAPGARSEDF